MAVRSPRWPSILPVAAWASALAYLAAIGLLCLPSVHYYYDAVAIRDAGTVWASLTWDVRDKRHFLPAAVLWHPEGPLQFLFLNGYYRLVGDLWPLKPKTTQVPNVLLIWLGAVVAYRLGSRLESHRFAGAFAACFVLTPWVGRAVRLPWVFNAATGLLELMTLLAYVRLAEDPSRARVRLAASAWLALYLSTGLDWLPFVATLGLFLWLNGRLGTAVKNLYNVLPALVLTVYAGWTVALFIYGRGDVLRQDLFRYSLLAYPFAKLGAARAPEASRVVTFAWEALGLVPLLALAGGLVAFARWRGRAREEPADGYLSHRFIVCMTAWTVLSGTPLVWAQGSVTYAYVVAVPAAYLAALALSRSRPALTWAGVAAMVLLQVQTGPAQACATRMALGDDRRVLAAAAFLNERRPDLLEAGRTALLPRNEASNVGQYARGANRRLVMPQDFPAERVLHSVGSPEPVLRGFVEAYIRRGELGADWLVLSTENLAAGPAEAAAFYRRLLDDSRIDWIARFQDERGRALWLGEVRPDGRGHRSDEAPVYPVGPLADLYERKYDRIGFLARNATLVDHY